MAPAAQPACNHSDNPACAVQIDPKIAAEQRKALELPGKTYGAGVTVAEAVPVSKILADPDAWAGKRVRVEGEVEDVCRMRGCWFTLKADTPGKTIKFKVTDGVMEFLPKSIGKRAVAEGVVRKMPLTLEQTVKVLEHEAQEQGRPFDPSTVKAAMTIVRIDGLGAVIAE